MNISRWKYFPKLSQNFKLEEKADTKMIYTVIACMSYEYSYNILFILSCVVFFNK